MTTAGTSIRETIPLLKASADVDIVGLVVSVDRQERTSTEGAEPAESALTELRREFSLRHCFAIVQVDQVIEHLRNEAVDGAKVLSDSSYQKVLAYRKRYGAL